MLDGVRVLEDAARHLSGILQRAPKRLLIARTSRLDDTGEQAGITLNQSKAFAAGRPKPPDGPGIDHQFLKERGRERRAECRDTTPAQPRPPLGHLI